MSKPLNFEQVMKAIALITTAAEGVTGMLRALGDGMTEEELDAFIDEQNAIQAEIRSAILSKGE